MKKKVEWVEFLSGIMILWMILYHVFIYTGNKQSFVCEELYKVFFFFMPWFFFKSGMFAKTTSIKECIASSFRSLLVPYVVFSVFGYGAYVLQQIILGETTIHMMIIEPAATLLFTGSILGNLPLWFLLALFLVKVLYQLLSKIKMNSIQIAALSLLVCYMGHVLGIKTPFYIWNAFSGLLFYSLGNMFKTLQFNRIVVWITFILYLLAIFVYPNSVQMRSNNLEMGLYILWPFTSMAAVVVWDNAAKLFEIIQGKTKVTKMLWGGVKFVGQNSLYLYITHSLIIVPVSAACSTYSKNWQFAIMSLVLILTLPVCCYFAKRVLDLVNNRLINIQYDSRKRS